MNTVTFPLKVNDAIAEESIPIDKISSIRWYKPDPNTRIMIIRLENYIYYKFESPATKDDRTALREFHDRIYDALKTKDDLSYITEVKLDSESLFATEGFAINTKFRGTLS